MSFWRTSSDPYFFLALFRHCWGLRRCAVRVKTHIGSTLLDPTVTHLCRSLWVIRICGAWGMLLRLTLPLSLMGLGSGKGWREASAWWTHILTDSSSCGRCIPCWGFGIGTGIIVGPDVDISIDSLELIQRLHRIQRASANSGSLLSACLISMFDFDFVHVYKVAMMLISEAPELAVLARRRSPPSYFWMLYYLLTNPQKKTKIVAMNHNVNESFLDW